ncbi:MAG: EamA family transporter [Candidatus Micrarchaeota archaeon]
MMEPYLLLAMLGYLFYAISTSIDKHMMNKKYAIIRTSVLKTFFEGSMLLLIGVIFFNVQFTAELFIGALLLALCFIISILLYYRMLTGSEISEVSPFLQSSEMLLAFFCSILLFHEAVSTINYLGIFVILFGSILVLSKNNFKIPKIGSKNYMIFVLIAVDVMYMLIAKEFVNGVDPIGLAIAMYLSVALLLSIYQAISKKELENKAKPEISRVMASSVSGGFGTLLLFTALSIGNASKVYPISGLMSVFVVIISVIFLKEKFSMHRLIGAILVFAGIYLTSIG